MAVISKKHNLLFVLNPRTASTALGALLTQNYDGEYIPREDILDDQGMLLVQRKHSTIRELVSHSLISEEQRDQFRKFVTVRNPFDSLLSIWVKKRYQYAKLAKEDENFFGYKIDGFMDDMEFVQKHTFSDWIRKQYGKAAEQGAQQSVNRKHYRGCGAFLRFENLQKEFSQLMKNWKCPDASIPMINRTAEKPPEYRLCYTDEARDIVSTVFCWDIETFDYNF